jgi:hypothetical protein
MREDQYRFLSLLGQPQVRLTAQEVAFVLNCTEEDVTRLMKAKLLKPLGQPAQNGTKLFSKREVLGLAEDDKWLHKVTLAISGHWQGKNARRKKPAPEPTPPAAA